MGGYRGLADPAVDRRVMTVYVTAFATLVCWGHIVLTRTHGYS